MTTFKVGQRVRYVNTILNPKVPTGTEGVVLGPWEGIDGLGYSISFPGCTNSTGGDDWGVYPHSIVPLTDPKADAFIESVKKWKPEPVVPLPAKIKERQ